MKLAFEKNIKAVIFIKIMLSMAIISLFAFKVSPLMEDMFIRITVSVLFTAAVCLYTSITITKQVREYISGIVSSVHKSAELLSQASTAMTAAAKGLSKNADIMMEFTGLLDGVADACEGKDGATGDGGSDGDVKSGTVIEASEKQSGEKPTARESRDI